MMNCLDGVALSSSEGLGLEYHAKSTISHIWTGEGTR